MTESDTRFRGVVFDLGGVLLHPDGALVSRALEPLVGHLLDPQACQDSFALADYHLSRQGRSDDDIAAIWAATLCLPPEISLAAWQHMCELDREIPNLWGSVHPCAVSVLRSLREMGLRTSVLSNAQGNVQRLLKEYGLSDFFDDVVDSALVGLEKPDRRVYMLALKRMGLQPDNCVYVGDSIRELEAAQELQLCPILYDRLGLYEATHSFHTLRDLCDLPGLLTSMTGP